MLIKQLFFLFITQAGSKDSFVHEWDFSAWAVCMVLLLFFNFFCHDTQQRVIVCTLTDSCCIVDKVETQVT